MSDVTLTVSYTGNINVGTATANASWTGDDNHEGSAGSGSFDITKASSAVTVSCPVSVVYTGMEQTPCTAKASGVGIESDVTLTVSYTGNINVGTATANASWTGDANDEGSTGSRQFRHHQSYIHCDSELPGECGLHRRGADTLHGEGNRCGHERCDTGCDLYRQYQLSARLLPMPAGLVMATMKGSAGSGSFDIAKSRPQ